MALTLANFHSLRDTKGAGDDVIVTMPQVAESIREGEVSDFTKGKWCASGAVALVVISILALITASWHLDGAAVGDQVQEDEAVVTIDTDKVRTRARQRLGTRATYMIDVD